MAWIFVLRSKGKKAAVRPRAATFSDNPRRSP